MPGYEGAAQHAKEQGQAVARWQGGLTLTLTLALTLIEQGQAVARWQGAGPTLTPTLTLTLALTLTLTRCREQGGDRLSRCQRLCVEEVKREVRRAPRSPENTTARARALPAAASCMIWESIWE